MKTLHIKNIPDNLYNRLQQLADAKNCSLSEQVIAILTQSIETENFHKKQTEILNSIQSRRFKVPKNATSSLTFLHNDRSR